MPTPYVYPFGASRTDGSAAMKNLLGGKGRQPGRDVPAGHHRAVGLHHQHRGLHGVHREGQGRGAEADRGRGAAGRGLRREGDGQALRQCRRPAAAVGALGRARLDAGHDGHDPQPGPERRGRGRPRGQGRQRALRLGFVPPLRADVRRRGDGPEAGVEGRPRPVRGRHRHGQGKEGRDARHRARRRRPEGAGGALQGADPRAHRPRLSHRPVGAALGRRGGGVRELEQRPRAGLPRAQRHPAVLGHGGQRAGDGVRQPRRQQRHRRGLHARRRHRRRPVQRRVPGQRAGRGRGRRHPHAAAGVAGGLAPLGRAGAGERGRSAREVPVAGRADAGDLPAAAARRDHAGEPLQGHAGPGVHDPGGQALDAADAQRQAHRRGDGAHRDGDAAAGHDRREDRAAARGARPAERPAAPDLRPRGAEGGEGHRARPAGVAGRGQRADRVLRRRGRGMGQAGQGGDPGAPGDLARRPARHERGQGHPHRARRHDLARRGGGARHGQVLRVGRRRGARRPQGAHHDHRRRVLRGRRVDFAQRLHRRGLRRTASPPRMPSSAATSAR